MKIIGVYVLTICVVIGHAQSFDAALEKGIKTEINMNRVMVSKSPLTLSNYRKRVADSLCLAYCQKYLSATQETSKAVLSDFHQMHDAIDQEMDKDNTVAYNFFVVHADEEYPTVLKEMLRDPDVYFYKLGHTQCSISVVKSYDRVFIGVISW